VRVVEGTLLHRLAGLTEFAVNSMHHQAIDRLGTELVASAIAPDGVIEGIESTDDYFLVGVQWHPEALIDTDPKMRRLFERFVAAAGDFRDARVAATSIG
jgi:putative glutamine amidotransferase